jgi:hypothetical protein
MMLRAAIAFLALTPVFAQGPAGDRVTVTFDRAVQIGSQTLPAGEYTVRQVTSASNPRVLEFTSNNGTKLDATVTAIPILQNTAPSETKVILEDEGGGARLSRIWVQGKNYGYEFPGKTAPGVKAGAIGLEASYNAPQPASVRQVQTAEVAPVQTAPTPAPVVVAQATPTPTPAPQNPPPVTDQTPAPVTTPSPIPATPLGWATLLFAGLTLAAAGLIVLWRVERAG